VDHYREYQLPDPVFEPPFAIPAHSEIQRLVNYFDQETSGDEESLWQHFLRQTLCANPMLAHRLDVERASLHDGFHKALRLLVIMGMLDFSSGIFSLSTIGIRIYKHVQPADPDPAAGTGAYINSDFSFMLPRESIPDSYLYLILAFTEIIKNDVVLSVRVTRESILRAYNGAWMLTLSSVSLSVVRKMKYRKISPFWYATGLSRRLRLN
jgi:hypothetical protein